MELVTANDEPFDLVPCGAERGDRAVLILHDWWGVTDYARQWGRRVGELGYRAAVVDLYDGKQPTDAETAAATMRAVDPDVAARKVRAALDYLYRPSGRIATLGWSFGGIQSLRAAIANPDRVAAAVFFYCRVVTDIDALRRLAGPVLAIYAESERTWPDKQRQFAEAMAAAGKVVEDHSFAAAHGFVNPGSERFDPVATDQAWQITVDFLARNLT
ncbi:MAG: dienelactone hydrolase family protein [Nitrospirota bacterium]|jgi:carboxymethylenebutenolidase